ncbi:LytR/AlgR family response regulator transcription factor [Aquirufa sp. ROCK-SH2]
MNVLIVEDETAAFESIIQLLDEIDLDISVLGNTESVSQTVNWLKNNPSPDLIFMDIHLSDGSAFLIFDYIQLDVPIIFTTAFDAYAIEAFKVNSIDYLLKPLKSIDLQNAILKFKKRTSAEIHTYLDNLLTFTQTKHFKERLLIPIKDTLLPIEVSKISYFYTSDKTTTIKLVDGNTLPFTGTLDYIFSSLNPKDFYRANKQFIIARLSVKCITIWFDSRLLISMNTETPESIYVSKNKASEFKNWIVNG